MKTFKNFTLFVALAGIISVSSCKKDATNTLASGEACFNVTPTSVDVNGTVTFSNCSNNSSSYSWDFGDGSSSTLSEPTHSYTSSGTYTIKLTAKNSDGVGDSVSKTVTVNDKIPVNLIINSITLTKWPATNAGAAWDNSTYPDIYPVIIQNSNTIYTSTIYYENCAPGGSFVYGNDSGLPVTIGNLNDRLMIIWVELNFHRLHFMFLE